MSGGRVPARVLVLAACAVLVLPACGANDQGAEFAPTNGEEAPLGPLEEEIHLAIEDRATAEIIGTAVLTAENASTRVNVLLDAYPEGSTAEIRSGGCDEPESEVAHDLGPVDDEGQIETTVDTSLEQLTEGQHGLFALGPDGEELGCALIAPFGVE